MTTRTSPYIFPFTPFRHLAETTLATRFHGPLTMEAGGLRALAEPFSPELALPEGCDLAERVLGLFTTPQVLFGEAIFVTSRAHEWHARLRDLIRAGRPLEFTILGFPFKMPVPLKTDRKTADFGELVSLKRLNEIGKAIARHHAPGACIHVFTEGPFHVLNGIDRSWADDYFASLAALVGKFDIDSHLVLHDLNTVLDRVPEFRTAWTDSTEAIRRRRDAGDPSTLSAIRDALPVRFHNIANPGIALDDLRRAYLDDGTRDDLRRSIAARAQDGVLAYRGFLEARDKISLLERCVPGGLAMTVSPRPGRLGVRPLPAPADKLPYHGVPVLSADRSVLRIEYLWDLRNDGGDYTRVHLPGDVDSAPFLYIER